MGSQWVRSAADHSVLSRVTGLADTSLPDAVPALMFYLNKQRSKVKVVWLDGQLSRCCISGHLAVYRFVLASWRPVPLSLLHLTTATIMMTTISRRTCFISGTVKSLCSIPTISLLPVVLSLPAFFLSQSLTSTRPRMRSLARSLARSAQPSVLFSLLCFAPVYFALTDEIFSYTLYRVECSQP